jgi:hypothetical protein
MPAILADVLHEKQRAEEECDRLARILDLYVKVFNDIYYFHACGRAGCAACRKAGRLVADQIRDGHSTRKGV